MPPTKDNGKPDAMPSAKAGTQRKTGGNTSTPPKATSAGLPKTPNLRASSDSLTLSPASSQCKEMQGLASHASIACTSMAAWRVNGVEPVMTGMFHVLPHVAMPPPVSPCMHDSAGASQQAGWHHQASPTTGWGCSRRCRCPAARQARVDLRRQDHTHTHAQAGCSQVGDCWALGGIA